MFFKKLKKVEKTCFFVFFRVFGSFDPPSGPPGPPFSKIDEKCPYLSRGPPGPLYGTSKTLLQNTPKIIDFRSFWTPWTPPLDLPGPLGTPLKGPQGLPGPPGPPHRSPLPVLGDPLGGHRGQGGASHRPVSHCYAVLLRTA